MGLTFVDVTIKRDRFAKDGETLEFLVDSGAVHSVVPSSVLYRLGCEPETMETFTMANGDKIRRHVGEAYFVYGDHRATSKVIFGEEGDSNLLGVLTLESFGLVLHPLRRELKPLPMLI